MTPRHSHIAIFAVLAVLLSGCGQKTAKTDEPTAMPAASAPTTRSRRPSSNARRPSQPGARAASGRREPAHGPAWARSARATDHRGLHRRAGAQGRLLRCRPCRHRPRGRPDHEEQRALDGRESGLPDPHRGAHRLQGNAREQPRDGGARGRRRPRALSSRTGVPDTRLWTVSYGSDRPVCAEKTDACAAKNRRVHFRVKKQ